jgi:hypothetical protein
MKVLKYLKSEGVAFDTYTCLGAAFASHLEVLQWLRSDEVDCPWNIEKCLCIAKHYKHREVIQWVESMKPVLDGRRSIAGTLTTGTGSTAVASSSEACSRYSILGSPRFPRQAEAFYALGLWIADGSFDGYSTKGQPKGIDICNADVDIMARASAALPLLMSPCVEDNNAARPKNSFQHEGRTRVTRHIKQKEGAQLARRNLYVIRGCCMAKVLEAECGKQSSFRTQFRNHARCKAIPQSLLAKENEPDAW